MFSTAASPSSTAGTWNDTSCTFIGFTAGRICEVESICGDGIVQPDHEACDDGNTDSFDGCSATCQNETLFFSEYVEGTSNNKALEIANPLPTAVNLTGCALRVYFNGNTTVGGTFNLTQTVAAGEVLVVCNSGSAAGLLATCDVPTNSNVLTFNGDDAVELICGGVTIDVIGQIGFDPGTEWGSGVTSTADNTIRRKCSVSRGDPVGNNVFDPAIEWDGFATDTFAGLGGHACFP
ncbi:MAG: lamin tail domain-containing protein [Myxococcales bacterium]|nr:lamin tail domain-containing protein [Myxococcales bacterium]